MDYILLVILTSMFTRIHCAIEEYCLKEKFTAQCPDNEVIIMTNSTYGRMKPGRCIDDISVGCYLNVLGIVDRWCSGKQSCQFDVFNDAFNELKPCKIRGLESYFEASYICRGVSTDSSCIMSDKESVPEQMIYLPGDSTKCGKHLSPWKIKASPGLRIEITLNDFTYTEGPSSSSTCQPLGYISEDVVRSNKTICGGSGSRISQIYDSVSSELTIVYHSTESRKYMGTFLVGYKFVGCPDPKLEGNSWYKRDGNKVVVGCKDEDTRWELTCIGHVLVGKYANCSESDNDMDSADGENQIQTRLASLPEHTIIVIIISVAVLISVLVLVGGVVYTFKRRHNTQQLEGEGTMSLTKDAIYTHNKKYGHNYGQSQMPIYQGKTYRPVHHASTCKRTKSIGQYSDKTMGKPIVVNGSMKSEAASWNYQNPQNGDKTYGHNNRSSDEIDYETPYESRAPESHTYFPLGTNSRPPAVNEI